MKVISQKFLPISKFSKSSTKHFVAVALTCCCFMLLTSGQSFAQDNGKDKDKDKKERSSNPSPKNNQPDPRSRDGSAAPGGYGPGRRGDSGAYPSERNRTGNTNRGDGSTRE